MKFVPGKTLEQQDIQAIHRGRQRLVNHRTAFVAQMRGLLLDRGIAFAQSITRARREIRILLEEGTSELSELFKSMLAQLYTCFLALDQQIAWFDREIEKVFRSSETCRRLRSEEHTSELQSLMRISYAVFCLKKTNTKH